MVANMSKFSVTHFIALSTLSKFASARFIKSAILKAIHSWHPDMISTDVYKSMIVDMLFKSNLWI